MDRKGQSALEYLMTYGWALVVIVIVVAALVVFGVFSTPKNCSPFGGRLLLKDYSITGSGISMVVQNNSTGNITVTGITATGTGGTLTYSGGSRAVGVGDANTFALAGTLTGSVNEEITVTYTTADSLTKTETTTCVGTV
jgi:hypothetical protein